MGFKYVGPGDLGLSRNPDVHLGPGSLETMKWFTGKDPPACGTAVVQVTFEEPKFVTLLFSGKKILPEILRELYTKVE